MWGCSSRVNTLSIEVIAHMAESGCIQVDLGIERGSDEALRKIQKDITIKQTIRTCQLLKRYGIRTFANFLVGLPEETPKDLADIKSLVEVIKPEVLSINKFTPYMGTQIYEEGYKEVQDERLNKWIAYMMGKYNPLKPALRFHLSRRYLQTVRTSKRRKEYMSQIPLLFREMVNQKWTR